DRAARGIIAPDEARQLPAEIRMHAEIVERAEIALLDGAALLGHQGIAVEHGLLVPLERGADLRIPLHVLNEIVGRQVRIEFLPGHIRLTACSRPGPRSRRRCRTGSWTSRCS